MPSVVLRDADHFCFRSNGSSVSQNVGMIDELIEMILNDTAAAAERTRSAKRRTMLPVGQISAKPARLDERPEVERPETSVRAEAIFSRPIKLIWPVQSGRRKFSAFPNPDSMLLSSHLPLAGGAVRGRHGRGAGGAVNAMAAQRILRRRTPSSRTVKSRGPGIPKLMPPRWRAEKRVIVHGDQNARRTGERAKQPLRSPRGECRMFG
ncbi:hypothetical protein [Bradyrhizobium sp. SRS-191]|uniref:hypothetical protein n=1 Tax=Bradyrhizobium sp. SRS-191 TaxID=2962606 RepID=UPI00211DFB14|nr:hypothetical protein [Bradyrhizobium sp. SRS-191]